MPLASIEQVKDVIKHPNADALDIVTVLGYKAITKRDQFKVDDLVVFIEPDTVLPDAPWAAFYKSKSSRVKAIKLRGEWSMGIVESLSILPSPKTRDEIVDQVQLSPLPGLDVAELIGVTKYEPPTPNDLNAKGNLPLGLSKTDEERYQSIRDLPYGELVDVTLKIDGSSLTVFCKKHELVFDYVTGVTSRSLELKPECNNKYTQVAAKYDLINKLKSYCEQHQVNLALRGEMYGNGIQNFKLNPHATKPLSFAAYSVYNLDTRQYEGTESPHYYETLCNALGIETVPTLEKNVVLTRELIQKYDEGLDSLNGLPFEGVVIKMKGGRSFKVINKHYDSKK